MHVYYIYVCECVCTCVCKEIAKNYIVNLAQSYTHFLYSPEKENQVILQWDKFGKRHFELLSHIDLKVL